MIVLYPINTLFSSRMLSTPLPIRCKSASPAETSQHMRARAQTLPHTPYDNMEQGSSTHFDTHRAVVYARAPAAHLVKAKKRQGKKKGTPAITKSDVCDASGESMAAAPSSPPPTSPHGPQAAPLLPWRDLLPPPPPDSVCSRSASVSPLPRERLEEQILRVFCKEFAQLKGQMDFGCYLFSLCLRGVTTLPFLFLFLFLLLIFFFFLFFPPVHHHTRSLTHILTLYISIYPAMHSQ